MYTSLKHSWKEEQPAVYRAQLDRSRPNKATRTIEEMANDVMALEPLQPSVPQVKMHERYSR